MSIERAVQLASQLDEELKNELHRTRSTLAVLSRLDSAALMEGVQAREAFQLRVLAIEQQLATTLQSVAAGAGLAELDLATMRRLLGEQGQILAGTLEGVRRLAGELKAQDATQKTLLERSLSVVRGYVRSIGTRPAAYTRLGAAPAVEAGMSSYSGRA